MKNERILILGATGAMAVYLIPELLNKGYEIVGVTLDDVTSDTSGLTYIKADAKDMEFLKELLKSGFDAIVDFMIYNRVSDFREYCELFLKNTRHYVFLSTYRIYADDSPLSETSKRLLDVEKPSDFVNELEYSIYKAEEEDLLLSSSFDNFTIVRPAITYSKKRFQLTTLEGNVFVWRMLNGKTVVLPEGAMEKEATLSWAGDVAKMLASIILNPKAWREIYNVSTNEHMTWEKIAEIYTRLGGLKYITVSDETFLDIIAEGAVYAKQQLLYDRCFDRVVDNRKILELSGLKEDDLMPIFDGLAHELKNIKPDTYHPNTYINDRMDAYLNSLNK